MPVYGEKKYIPIVPKRNRRAVKVPLAQPLPEQLQAQLNRAGSSIS